MIKRDTKIFQDYKSGLSYSDISKLTGLTRQRIQQIVKQIDDVRDAEGLGVE